MQQLCGDSIFIRIYKKLIFIKKAKVEKKEKKMGDLGNAILTNLPCISLTNVFDAIC